MASHRPAGRTNGAARRGSVARATRGADHPTGYGRIWTSAHTPRSAWHARLRFAPLSDMTLATVDVIAFVSTTNPARAETFYADALGLQLVDKSPFALVFDAHGTMLRVTIVEKLDPAPNTVLGWEVTDISETARALAARGIVFLRYAGMSQNDQGIWQSPGAALIAWFKDADGNVLSLTQF
jgi:catechol 2,3-dioxygenase-like lactoylglutathione lyase family enzyme